MDLTHLLDLEPNWDSYGAERISELAVDTAMALLTCVAASKPTVVVTKDGLLEADFLKLK